MFKIFYIIIINKLQFKENKRDQAKKFFHQVLQHYVRGLFCNQKKFNINT